MIEFNACSVMGSMREKNEDRIMVNNSLISAGNICGFKDNEFIAVVCDGVGGNNGGEVAAELVAKSFRNIEIDLCSPLTISRHLHRVNREIIAQQRRYEFLDKMASTVAGLIVKSNRYLLFNLGDTRIYKYYNGNIYQLTRDHTIAHPYLNSCSDAITCYIGGDGNACFPSLRRGIVETESIFLICSDGIYKGISENEIKDILSSNETIEYKKRAILKQSLQNDSCDDKSLVIARFAA